MVYLKFTRKCVRKNEIDLLVAKFGVDKMPIVNNFPKMIEENTSVYALVLKEGFNEEKLDDYFSGNKGVKKLTQEDIDNFMNPEFYIKLEEQEQGQNEHKQARRK